MFTGLIYQPTFRASHWAWKDSATHKAGLIGLQRRSVSGCYPVVSGFPRKTIGLSATVLGPIRQFLQSISHHRSIEQCGRAFARYIRH